jgi:hypothetical protein
MKNESVLKLTEKIASDMLAKFSSDDFQTTLKSLKEVSDTGTFEMVISTDDVDRHGEIVDQKGIDFSAYMKNPVVLWGHNHNQIPVGITDEIYTRNVGGQTQTVAKGRFASHEFAQTLRALFDAGMLKTSSIGFIPKEYQGNTITKSELLEWSFVSIPANPYALALGKSGFNVEELIAKGVFLSDVKEGDEIETPVENPEEEPKAEEKIEEEETPEETPEEVPAEETPKEEEPTPEPEEEKSLEKGALSDTVEDQEMRKAKYEKFQLMDRLYWAFCEVYFDEETPVEEYDNLVSEFVSLLTGATTEGRLIMERDVAELKAKHLETVKAGRVLSSKNRAKISDAILALEEVLAADESEDGKKSQPERVKNSEIEAIEDFLNFRKTMQQVAGLLGEALYEAKKDASKYIDEAK